jgi:uncharacterized protein
MMKVILDANIWISYLLTPAEGRTITQVVEACFASDVELVVPQELIDEILENVQESPYLWTRIPQAVLQQLVEQLTLIATLPIPLTEELPPFSHDPDDDYLIAYGLVYEVDYLVTGDRHLLILKQVEHLTVIEPPMFLDLFK